MQVLLDARRSLDTSWGKMSKGNNPIKPEFPHCHQQISALLSQVLHDCLSLHWIYTYSCYLNLVRCVWECYQWKPFKHSWRQNNTTNMRKGRNGNLFIFFNQAISQRSLVINFKAKITVMVLRSGPRQHLYTGILRMPPANSTSNAHGVNSSLLLELKTSLFLLNLTAAFNTVGHILFLKHTWHRWRYFL